MVTHETKFDLRKSYIFVSTGPGLKPDVLLDRILYDKRFISIDFVCEWIEPRPRSRCCVVNEARQMRPFSAQWCVLVATLRAPRPVDF